MKLFAPSPSASTVFALQALRDAGVQIVDRPEEARYILVGVPAVLQEQLPADATVIGGPLKIPGIDLMLDPEFVSRNAAITAHCAVRFAMERLECTPEGLSVLVIGWGRIGKCLARLLRGMDARVTIAARKETDRAMAMALGYEAIDISSIDAHRYALIYNTAPAPILADCGATLAIDLASIAGLTGKNVLWARGLPGKMAPRSAGALIARTLLRLTKEEAS